jgi:ABC-type phosphate transport system permease subunit
MQGTNTTDRKEERMRTQSLDVTNQTFSDLELKNQKFKRIAWAAAFLLVGVVTVLVLQIVGVIKY